MGNFGTKLKRALNARYAYEFGKRWDVKTPRFAIKHHMGRIHVSTRAEDIERDIIAAIDRQNNPEYTPKIRRECVRYALLCHEKNRELYNHVMGGV